MKSGTIKEIVFAGKTYDVEDVDIVLNGRIDELGLVGATGDIELIETKTDRKIRVTFKITSSEYLDEVKPTDK